MKTFTKMLEKLHKQVKKSFKSLRTNHPLMRRIVKSSFVSILTISRTLEAVLKSVRKIIKPDRSL